MIRAAIFDIGGVLAHDIWGDLLLDADRGIAAQYNLDRTEAQRIGALLWESFAYIPETPRNSWRELEHRYWRQFIGYYRERLPSNISPDHFIEMTDDFVRPIEGTEAIVDQLQSKGVTLAISSNNNEFWYRREVDKCRLNRFFSPSKILLSCRVGVSKSSSRFEMLHAVIDAVTAPRKVNVF